MYIYTGSSTIEWPTSNEQCPSELFECSNKECILPAFHCDGHIDCMDQSDEDKCGMDA